MYKFTTHLSNSHLVLIRKKLSDGSCAALVVVRAPVRRYAKEFFAEKCPPPPPKQKSNKLLWGAVGATLATGAAVVYAKHTPEVRNWLESNVPWANDFVGVVYQENTTHYKFAMNQLSKMSTMISEFVFGKLPKKLPKSEKEGVTPLDFPQRSEQDIEKDAAEGFKPKAYVLPPPAMGGLYSEHKPMGQAEVEHEATLVQTEECDTPDMKSQRDKDQATKALHELETRMFAKTKDAIDGFKKAATISVQVSKIIGELVETPLESMNKSLFETLNARRTARDDAMNSAKAAAVEAELAFKAMMEKVQDPNLGLIPPEKKTVTKRRIAQFQADIKEAEVLFNKEYERTIIADRYWDKVSEARKQYQSELQILFPGIDLCSRVLDPKGDTDLLLLYTMKQVALLQNEIAELQTVREHNINKAIECNDEKELIEAKAEEMVKKDRLAKELDFQKRMLQVTKEHQARMKRELQKQYELQEDIMQKRLKKKEDEIMKTFKKRVSELIEKDRIEYKKELAAIAGKLKAIEQTLKQRAEAEAEARQSQSVWAAAEALLAATRRAAATTTIQKEIDALAKAGKDDKLVSTVLGGISKEAREEGISTEKSLKDRFDKVEKTATNVALVGREGASLPVYFLSWLQSKLLFQKFSEIPQDELNDKPTDFSKLDTYDIMQRARYHLDHGNLDATLRYVNLLQGAPRAAAACWAQAARRHLEVKQAAETVMAHASLAALAQEREEKAEAAKGKKKK